MARYRYLIGNFAQVGTANEVMQSLPLNSVKFSDVLNAPGAFSGRIPMDHPKATSEFLAPGKRTLYVERDGVIVWGGVLWRLKTGQVESDRFIEVQAEGFWSWVRRQVLQDDKTYLCTDQTNVAADLMNTAMWYDAVSSPAGQPPWWLTIQAAGATATSVTKTYKASELKNIGDEVAELANANGPWGDAAVDDGTYGFDFSITSSWSGQSIAHNWNWYWPRRGVDHGVHGIIRPGPDVLDFNYSVDAYNMGNVVWGAGAGNGDGRPIAWADNGGRAAGYRRLVQQVTFNDTADYWMVNWGAQSVLQAIGAPIVLPSVRMVASPFLRNVKPGDTVRIHANDRIIQINDGNGHPRPFRVEMTETDISDDGGHDEVTLTFFTKGESEAA